MAVDTAAAAPDSLQGAKGVEPDALIYSVARLPESVFQTGRAVSVVSGATLRRRGARTLPEALMEEAAVFVQQTAYGHGAPIIRGMIGKQILILINGVRLNNATYRFGPNQYLSNIDLETVERVEIVRGVGSVLGSDALGGIINVITKTGPPEGTGSVVGGRASTRLSSADQSRSMHGEIAGRFKSLRFLAGATYRLTRDVRAGGEPEPQPGTGYSEEAANFHVEQSFGTNIVSASVQVTDLHDVPRTDRVASGSHLRYIYDPQRAQIATVRFENQASHWWANGIQITGFWNRQEEGREEIFVSSPAVKRVLRDVDVLKGINAEASLFIGDHRLVYGADYTFERIQSSGASIRLADGSSTARRGIYTNGATYRTAAIYVQDRFEFSSWLTPTLGLRYGGVSTGGTETASVGVLDLEGSTASLTGAGGLIIHASDWLNVVANVTKGFRAPNLDDVSAFEVRPEGTEVPNPRARPEHIDSYEIGFKYQGAKASASVFYFTSKLSNLLVRSSGEFNGLSYIDANRNGQRDAGERPVLQKQNVGLAGIVGSEARGRYSVIPSVIVYGHVTWTRGNDTGKKQPLGKIPPFFGMAAVRWEPGYRARPWAEVAYLFAGSQRRLSAEDVTDTRIGPAGTDAWRTLTVRGGARTLRLLTVTAALENILDEKYKYHGSGVYRPGRQVVMNAQYAF